MTPAAKGATGTGSARSGAKTASSTATRSSTSAAAVARPSPLMKALGPLRAPMAGKGASHALLQLLQGWQHRQTVAASCTADPWAVA